MKPISLWLGPTELHYCKYMARKAELGGKSPVREDKRQETLAIDQIVGQIGQYALAIYFFGEPSRYYIQRLVANAHPEIGDSGQDILGSNMDVKTSLMRGSTNPMTYRLPIRPKELHEGHVYFLALVKPNGESALKMTEPIQVYIAGWVTDSDMPDEPDDSGIFKGAYTIPASKLNPLPPIQWDWRKYDE